MLRRSPALLVALFALAGCQESLARRDGVTAFAGDAQAQSIAAQAVNPWPKAAYRKIWITRPLPPPLPDASAPSTR